MNRTNYHLPMIWIDCEMSGLDLSKDVILELAAVVTDKDLNIISEKPLELVIHTSDNILDNMNDWCRIHHGESGLTELAKKSTISMQDAERQVIEFIKPFIRSNNMGILAGNTVHVDKQFIAKDMPKLHELLHYRVIDVSTVKELCARWDPSTYRLVPRKQLKHRAYDDIIESIEELKFYRSRMSGFESK